VMTTETTTFPFVVYRCRVGIASDCIAGFMLRADALTFVKAAHFPNDFVICDAATAATTMAESDFTIFDTRGMTHQQVLERMTI
jgi:hypothetical protein